MTSDLNTFAAWLGILAGIVVGAINGLFFHNPDWLGGYGSWRRRLTRLAHISFFGLAFINLAYALTIHELGWPAPPKPASMALAASVGIMPLLCYLAAWRIEFRRLFFIPVCCVLSGVLGILLKRMIP
jgi:hypothetical protein